MKQLMAPRRPSLTHTCVISDLAVSGEVGLTLRLSDADVVDVGCVLRSGSAEKQSGFHRTSIGGEDLIGRGRRPEGDLVEKRG